MKILAICDVDEDKIKNVSIHETEIIDKVVNEFGWLSESGITLDGCKEINKVTSQETYQAFIWDELKEKYVPFNRSAPTKYACEKRIENNLEREWAFPSSYNFNKIKICKQTTYSIKTKYEDVEGGD